MLKREGSEGSPLPLGATWREQTSNCGLYYRHTESITLLRYGAEDLRTPLLRHSLDYLHNKSARI